jgi:hypothetical protein
MEREGLSLKVLALQLKEVVDRSLEVFTAMFFYKFGGNFTHVLIY